MIRTKFILIILIIFSYLSCSKTLYPIYDKLESVDSPYTIHEAFYDSRNLFQLRIRVSKEYLNVSDNDYRDNLKLTSDIPIKRYQQITTPQNNNDIGLTVEETYLYLENFKDSNSLFGYVFYFVTFPTIDSKKKKKKNERAKKYFNDSSKLYTNIIRQVRLGFWMKRDKELLILIKNGKKEVAVSLATINSIDKITLEKISHPSNLQDSNKISSIIRELISSYLNDNTNARQLYLSNANNWFDQIIHESSLIKINSVLNVGEGNSGLVFTMIPQNKNFIYERDANDSVHIDTVKNFKIGYAKNIINPKNCHKNFYFGLTGKDGELNDYKFKKRNTFFIDSIIYDPLRKGYYYIQ